MRLALLLSALFAFAMLANGCVVSENERDAGPGEEKK
jgi:hypothetical protein